MQLEGVCVKVVSGEFEAQQVKAFLEANGVECEFRGEALRNTHGLTLDGLGEVRVLVAREDEERALDLLAQVASGALTLPESADEPPADDTNDEWP